MVEVRITEDSISSIFLTDAKSGMAVSLTEAELEIVKAAEELSRKAAEILCNAQLTAVADPNSTHSREVRAAQEERAKLVQQPGSEGMVVTITRESLTRPATPKFERSTGINGV